VKVYYDRRAAEYDDWYEGRGRFADRERPAWRELLGEVAETLRAMPPAATLDVACGTGYATRWLPGRITGLDQSERMLEIARRRVPRATFVRGEALALPFPDDSFERVTTMHFYGHLEGDDQLRFRSEAHRVAPELVVVDSALREDVEPEEWQERVLNDGSSWTVYKRYFSGDGLADELGRAEVLHASRWFVVVRSQRAG
jgi:demethylmenaquinone methyltransferase/2-methoxy-6-polyprenyl-1,4-benzoquinol methylase